MKMYTSSQVPEGYHAKGLQPQSRTGTFQEPLRMTFGVLLHAPGMSKAMTCFAPLQLSGEDL